MSVDQICMVKMHPTIGITYCIGGAEDKVPWELTIKVGAVIVIIKVELIVFKIGVFVL